jgi:hypothetical protein
MVIKMEKRIMCKYFPSMKCYTGDPTACFKVYNKNNPTCPLVNPKVTSPVVGIVEEEQNGYYSKVLEERIK